MFHFTVETNKSVEDAVSAVVDALKDEQFGVQWKFNIKDKLNEKGVQFDNEFVVLEVCNPHEAKKVLTANLLVGYFLPCKIVVYKEEGRTKIGMPRPTVLMELAGGGQLMETAKNIEDRLIASIEKAK